MAYSLYVQIFWKHLLAWHTVDQVLQHF